jgi:hypothetical protein
MGNRRRKKPTTPSKLGTPSPSSKKPAITLDDPARGPVDDSDEGLLPRLAAAVFGVVAAVASLVTAAATLVGAAPASALRADFEDAAAEEATRQPRKRSLRSTNTGDVDPPNTEELKLQKDRWRERLETLERSEVYIRARADETRELVAFAEEASSDLVRVKDLLRERVKFESERATAITRERIAASRELDAVSERLRLAEEVAAASGDEISDTDCDDMEGDDDAEGDMSVGGDGPSTGPGPEGVDTIAGKVFQATGFDPAGRDELRRMLEDKGASLTGGDKLKTSTYGLIATKRLKKNPGSNMKMHDAMHKGKPVFTMSEIKEFEDVTIEEMALDVDKEEQGSAPWKGKAMPTVRLSKAQAEAFVGPPIKLPDGLTTSQAQEKEMEFCECTDRSCPHLHRCKCSHCGPRYFCRGKAVDGPVWHRADAREVWGVCGHVRKKMCLQGQRYQMIKRLTGASADNSKKQKGAIKRSKAKLAAKRRQFLKETIPEDCEKPADKCPRAESRENLEKVKDAVEDLRARHDAPELLIYYIIFAVSINSIRGKNSIVKEGNANGTTSFQRPSKKNPSGGLPGIGLAKRNDPMKCARGFKLTELSQHGPPATLLTDAGHAHEFALDVEELTLDEVDLYAFYDDKNLKPLNRAHRRVLARKSGPYHVGVRLIPVLNGELPTVDGYVCWLNPTLEEKHAARVAKIERDRRAATSS